VRVELRRFPRPRRPADDAPGVRCPDRLARDEECLLLDVHTVGVVTRRPVHQAFQLRRERTRIRLQVREAEAGEGTNVRIRRGPVVAAGADRRRR
jgi:hypothetical protein